MAVVIVKTDLGEVVKEFYTEAWDASDMDDNEPSFADALREAVELALFLDAFYSE